MAGRSPARFLAPLALVVFAIALVIVVASSSESQESVSPASGERTRTDGGEATATPTATRESTQTTQTYKVKPGDTPSGIAAAHDITVGELLELNPDVDPANLRIGATIKVR